MYEVIIVGGGPAGLSAALILGRCLRRVLVIDCGLPRNRFSNALHGYLSHDGIPPSVFLQLGREELKKYQTIKFLHQEVAEASKTPDGFIITTQEGQTFQSKKLLLATGVIDDVPKIEGIMEFYGKSVHICPYCDAWEVRGKQLGVYGKGQRGLKLALNMLTWSNDIVLFTNGPSELSDQDNSKLQAHGIQLKEEKIKYLRGESGKLRHIVLQNREVVPREALFFNTESFLRSSLLEQLGCPFTEEEGVPTDKYEKTKVPGLYVAGNILREFQLAIVAAAEGAQAAFGINTALTKESLGES